MISIFKLNRPFSIPGRNDLGGLISQKMRGEFQPKSQVLPTLLIFYLICIINCEQRQAPATQIINQFETLERKEKFWCRKQQQTGCQPIICLRQVFISSFPRYPPKFHLQVIKLVCIEFTNVSWLRIHRNQTWHTIFGIDTFIFGGTCVLLKFLLYR